MMAALFGPYAADEFPEGWPDGPVAAVPARWSWRLARAALGAPVPARPPEPAPPVRPADVPVPAVPPAPGIAPSYTLTGQARTRPDRLFGPFALLGVGGGGL
jgi:hypothetical protein